MIRARVTVTVAITVAVTMRSAAPFHTSCFAVLFVQVGLLNSVAVECSSLSTRWGLEEGRASAVTRTSDCWLNDASSTSAMRVGVGARYGLHWK